MLKLQTAVEAGRSTIPISTDDRILVMGSCFADNIGKKMADLGLNVLVNPFGTLYNPVSILNSLKRLVSGEQFRPEDCRQMGSGSELICSFSHHTSFARRTEDEFLENANARLSEAVEFFRSADKVIITFGTVWCFRHIEDGIVVSNCLKRHPKEFIRSRLPLEDAVGAISEIFRLCSERGQDVIFTVSPVRHLSDGAHGNQISKATLLLAVDEVCSGAAGRGAADCGSTGNCGSGNGSGADCGSGSPAIADCGRTENCGSTVRGRCAYFPAYEIVMDELRDYRFYAEDMCHPSQQAVGYIWERFCDFALPGEEFARIRELEKKYRASLHREQRSK